MDQQQIISRVVAEVLARLQQQQSVVKSGQSTFGVYEKMEDAIAAANKSFLQLREAGVSGRRKAIAAIRRACTENAKAWGEIEFAETKIGRLEAKIEKLRICADLVPGVEMLDRMAFSGDYGLTIIDFAPWGVIGAVTPATHSVPTLTGNAINMIAAGNSVVYNTHPAACQVAAIAIRGYNEAIFHETGISDLLCTVVKPTLGTFDELCKHPDVKLLCITGGPAVVAAAMKTGKTGHLCGPGQSSGRG